MNVKEKKLKKKILLKLDKDIQILIITIVLYNNEFV